MLPGSLQSILILMTMLLFYAMDFLMIRRYDKKRQASGSGRAWDFMLVVLPIVAVLVLQPVFLPVLSIRTTQWWGLALQLLGILIILAALSLHTWAREHLQQFYAERVEIQPEHQVIDTGPYKLMRHPIITSFFGIVTGWFLINPALTTLVTLVYTLWDFNHAAQQEEDLLGKNVPGYAEYARRTPRFLPRLSRNR